MQEIVLFVLCFILVFIIYEIFIVRKACKNEKKKILDKQPMEIKYLLYRYKFDLKKINYHKLLHICAVVSSFDIAVIVTVAFIFENYVWQLLIVLVLVVPVILFSYHIVYLIYKKKGLI